MIQLPNHILLVSEALYKAIKSTVTQSPVIGVLADFSGFEIRPTPMLPMRFRVTREMRRSKRYHERKEAQDAH